MLHRIMSFLVEKLRINLITQLRRRPYLWLLVIGGNLSGLAVGSLLEILNPAGLKIDLKGLEILIHAAPIIGAGINATWGDLAGRKLGMFASNFLILIGNAILIDTSMAATVVARFLIGVGIGLASAVGTLYVAEVSPTEIRGSSMSINGLLTVLGQILATITNAVVKGANCNWRWGLILPSILLVTHIGFIVKLPESPRMMGQQEKYDEVLQFFRKTLGDGEVETDEAAAREACQMIKEAVEIAKLNKAITGNNIFKKIKYSWIDMRQRVLSAILLEALQQFVGLNLVIFLTPIALKEAGVESRILSLSIPLIFNLIGAIVTTTCVDKYSRKFILMISLVLIFLDLIILSTIYEAAGTLPKKRGGLKVIVLGAYTIFFRPGIGLIPWVLPTEIFPLHYRTFCSGISNMTSWISNLIVTSSAKYLRDKWGPKYVFIGNAVITALGAIAAEVLVMETKGQSLEHVFQHVSYQRWPIGRQLQDL